MFSVIVPGRPCITDGAVVDSQPNGQPTKLAFTFPSRPAFDEIAVFFLPGTVLPPDTAAAIYIQFPDAAPTSNGPEFRFIGALANEKPSSIFKVGPAHPATDTPQLGSQDPDSMLDDGSGASAATNGGMVTLGISIEPVQTVAPQLAALEAQSASMGASTDVVLQSPRQRQQKAISTKVLAQRIIGNAFNFLASFASSDPSHRGEEVIPLKSFRDWWSKFERKVELDPSFLEREEPNV